MSLNLFTRTHFQIPIIFGLTEDFWKRSLQVQISCLNDLNSLEKLIIHYLNDYLLHLIPNHKKKPMLYFLQYSFLNNLVWSCLLSFQRKDDFANLMWIRLADFFYFCLKCLESYYYSSLSFKRSYDDFRAREVLEKEISLKIISANSTQLFQIMQNLLQKEQTLCIIHFPLNSTVDDLTLQY